MNAIRDYYRRNVYLSNLVDETCFLLSRMEPHEGARIRPARLNHLRKLFRYNRRAKGAKGTFSLS